MASFVSDDLFEHQSNSTPRRGPKPSTAKKAYVLSPTFKKVLPEVMDNGATAQGAAATPEIFTLVGQIRALGKNATSRKTSSRLKQDPTQLLLPTFAKQRFIEVVLDGVMKGDGRLFQAISQSLAGREGGELATINHHPLAMAHRKLSTFLRRLPTWDELKLSNRAWEQMDRGQFHRKANKLLLKFTAGTLYNMMQSLREDGVTSLSTIRTRLKSYKAAKDLREADDDHLLAYCENFGLKFAPEISIKAHCRIQKRNENVSLQEVSDQLPSYVSKELGPEFSQVLHEAWKDIVGPPAKIK